MANGSRFIRPCETPWACLTANSAIIRAHDVRLRHTVRMTVPRPSLEVRGLTCLRGESVLFEQLDFSLSVGEALHVMGANGSGKTSLLRIVAGLMLADEGEIYWRGQPLERQRSAFQAQLGYLGHHLGLKAELSVRENLKASLGLQGLRLDDNRLMAALAGFDLSERADLPVRALSAGQRQRVALARLLLLEAELWILDEPLTALDGPGVAQLERLAEAHLQAGGMLLMTSHQAVQLGPHLRTLSLS